MKSNSRLYSSEEEYQDYLREMKDIFTVNFIASLKARQQNMYMYQFVNGYGAYVRRTGSRFELTVAVKDNREWKATFETPVCDDVLKYLDGEDVSNVLECIRSLPPKKLSRATRKGYNKYEK